MFIKREDGTCRECDGTLEIVDVDDVSMTVCCLECSDSYRLKSKSLCKLPKNTIVVRTVPESFSIKSVATVARRWRLPVRPRSGERSYQRVLKNPKKVQTQSNPSSPC